MLISRTTGSASVVPELVYADVAEAIDWLCDTFEFTEIWRAGGHRARLTYGNGKRLRRSQITKRGNPRTDGSEPHGARAEAEACVLEK